MRNVLIVTTVCIIQGCVSQAEIEKSFSDMYNIILHLVYHNLTRASTLELQKCFLQTSLCLSSTKHIEA